jgi:5-methylcytosine-specific restriction protein A
MRITQAQIHQAYAAAKSAFEGDLSESEAAANLSSHHGINSSSANTFVRVLSKMLAGQRFTRGLSVPATRYYLERVLAEYGKRGLHDALHALERHTAYYEGKRHTTMHGLRGIHNEFLSYL